MPSRTPPPGFQVIAFAGMTAPVAMAFAPDGDLRRRAARVVKVTRGNEIANFIDLRNEVNSAATGGCWASRWTQFLTNRYVYLPTRRPVYGPPEESADQGTFTRLVLIEARRPAWETSPTRLCGKSIFAKRRLDGLSGVRVDALGGALRFAPTTAC